VFRPVCGQSVHLKKLWWKVSLHVQMKSVASCPDGPYWRSTSWEVCCMFVWLP
jgi:hypothetical protein